MLLLPRLRVHKCGKLLWRRSNPRICAPDDGKLVCATVGTAQKPIAKLRQENGLNSASDSTGPIAQPCANIRLSKILNQQIIPCKFEVHKALYFQSIEAPEKKAEETNRIRRLFST
jgi:hypothetical protein